MHSFGTETLWYLAQAATLSPFAVIAGNISQKLRLPRITGFLLTGIVCGPYVLKLLTEKAVRAVWPVDYVCLSVIAVAAGSELQISELHRTKSQVWKRAPTNQRSLREPIFITVPVGENSQTLVEDLVVHLFYLHELCRCSTYVSESASSRMYSFTQLCTFWLHL